MIERLSRRSFKFRLMDWRVTYGVLVPLAQLNVSSILRASGVAEVGLTMFDPRGSQCAVAMTSESGSSQELCLSVFLVVVAVGPVEFVKHQYYAKDSDEEGVGSRKNNGRENTGWCT
jgi:hypothetical protein